MSEQNPYDPPESIDAEVVDERPEVSGGRATYNAVTDLVTGANVRKWDNLLQVLAIFVCTPLGVVIGMNMATVDRGFGALAGGLLGLLAGLFGSGIFLMIYRAIRHARGRHD